MLGALIPIFGLLIPLPTLLEAETEEAPKDSEADKDAAKSEKGEADFRTLPSVGTWFTGPFLNSALQALICMYVCKYKYTCIHTYYAYQIVYIYIYTIFTVYSI